MKYSRTVDEVAGFNNSPLGGEFITSGERDFAAMNVAVGSSVIYNTSKGTSGIVTAVTDNRIDATGVHFDPGDFFYVTLDPSWTVQNSDGPLIEVECKRCGWSYPAKELVGGLCKTCIDEA